MERGELDNWHRARLLAFVSGKPYFEKKHQNMTIYEFMPLPGDPSEAEIKEQKKKQENRESDEALQIIEMYEKMGLLKPKVVN